MSLVGRAPSTLSESVAQYHCPHSASFVCQSNETQHSTSRVFIIMPQPIYTSTVLLKFGVDIQSQTKVTESPEIKKNPIWPPSGHFESDVA